METQGGTWSTVSRVLRKEGAWPLGLARGQKDFPEMPVTYYGRNLDVRGLEKLPSIKVKYQPAGPWTAIQDRMRKVVMALRQTGDVWDAFLKGHTFLAKKVLELKTEKDRSIRKLRDSGNWCRACSATSMWLGYIREKSEDMQNAKMRPWNHSLSCDGEGWWNGKTQWEHSEINTCNFMYFKSAKK